MKRILLYISALFILIGCSESEYDGTRTPSLNRRYLYVQTKSLNFEALPSTQKVNIESDQTDWTVSIPTNWISANQLSGNNSTSVDFTTQLNNSADTSRVCIATIASNVSDWVRSFPITITQSKHSPFLTVSENSISCSAVKQSISIPVSTNAEYTLNNTGSSWLHIESFTNNEVKLIVDENNTGEERNASLTLKAKSYPGTVATVEVRQKIANISSTKNKLSFGHNSSSQIVEIDSEASWSATATSWISVTPKTGTAGNTEVTISVPNNASTNSRYGSVYLNIAGNNNIEIPIEQEGVSLVASTSNVSFDSFGGTETITITSNDNWQITSIPEWISVNTSSGNGNETIQISTRGNDTTKPKHGEIIVSTTNNVASKTITVTQEAKQVEYSDATLAYGYASSTKTISFTTNGNWSATNDAEWISIDKTSGSGNASLAISVNENNTLEEREGHITLLIVDQPYTITVHQDCKYLTLSSSAFTFSADAGSTTISIGSNTQWKSIVTDGGDWLSVSSTDGTNDTDMTINVSENKTVSARSGMIEIEIPNVHTYIIDVTQSRRYIKTDMASVDFLPSGGQISFNVITDGTYEVSRIGDWFGFVKSGDCITVVAQENSSVKERKGALTFTLLNLYGGKISLLVPITQLNK